MKRKIFTLLVAIAATMMCQAEVVTADQALAVARGFVNQSGNKLRAGAPLKLAYQARSLDGKPDYYVFNNGDDGGFIIVSGDDRTVPVWGYSTSGSFDYESMPESAKWWYSEYQRQLQYLRDNPQVKARKPVKLTTSVAPLLTTKWDQCAPYNHFCPFAKGKKPVSEGINPYVFHAATGCVATALAQIMNYHKWPVIGMGSKTYDTVVKEYESQGSNVECNTPIKLTTDFSQSNYRWDLMKDEYNVYYDINNNNALTYEYRNGNNEWVSSNEFALNTPLGAVSKLMSDVGQAVSMVYGASERGGSTANANGVKDGMQNYLRYNVIIYERDESEYVTAGDWDRMLCDELDAHRPIFYGGATLTEELDENGNKKHARHAFVFDGYNDQGMFHVNWGWGGKDDGNFYSTLLEEKAGYELEHTAIFLTPNRTGKNWSAVLNQSDFGAVKTNSRVSSSLSVVGQNLDQDVNVSLSGANASMFSTVETVTAAEANAEGGKTVKVIYHPTATGEHTAQITVNFGEGIEPVTFNINGSSFLNNDANGDENVDVADVVAAIAAILNDGTLPFEDMPDVGTVVAMINAILNGETNLDIDDGLVAYYPFDGDARDASGHGNDGEVHNLVSTHGVNGDTNGAWHFMGYNNPGYIRIPNSESLQFTDGFTFACYVKPLDWSGMNGYSDNTGYSSRGVHSIFAKDHDRNGPSMLIEQNDNMNMMVHLQSFLDQSKWADLSSEDKIEGNKLNVWVHIAVTYSKTKARMYIDGRLVDERNITADFTQMNSHDLYLGKFSDRWYPLNGVLDEVRIYNRMLTSAEVMELANDNMEKQSQKHPFKLSQKSVTLAVGETVTINMINGTGSYSLGSNVSIVDFDLDNANESFTLTGKGVGTTNVTVIDVNTQTTIQLPVTVTEPQTETFTVNGVTFTMVAVEGGTFTMGAADDDPEAYDREKPAHRVTVSSFSIGETEVTQALWVAVMGNNPSAFQGNLNHPVEYIEWNKCQEFIAKLNQMTGKNFRLPTEAEWEFAARGGNKSMGYKYSGSNNINDVAWWGYFDGGNSGWRTHPVAQLLPNELGLYDMSGNVYEWCQDWYGSYISDNQVNPTGPESGSIHIYRGGCWYSGTRGCCVSYRVSDNPSIWDGTVGLRLAMDDMPPDPNPWSGWDLEHEYVDLGLPSGTLWATCNVGADNPEDYGDYFAWGETEPKDYYYWNTYKWCNGSERTITKYCTDINYGFNGFTDGKTKLDPEDDAAYVNWGPSWRMPSYEQQRELVEQCTWTWTTSNGVDGRLVTGPNGNNIFLPAAGYCWREYLDAAAGLNGSYWSRTLSQSYTAYVGHFGYAGDASWGSGSRIHGCPVRAVRVPQD